MRSAQAVPVLAFVMSYLARHIAFASGRTFLIWIFSREANHLLPAPQVNSYTPSSHATRAVVRGP